VVPHQLREEDALAARVQEAIQARTLGWRYFLALAPGVAPPERTIMCLADREGDKARTCDACGICDGTNGRPSRTSVYLVEHGGRSTAKHKRGAKSISPQALRTI